MAFTAVGTAVSTNATTGQATVSVVTTNVGDLVTMFTVVGATSPSVTGMTGGGCGTWQQIGTPGVSATTLQMWYGTVATAGTANATLTFSGAIGSTQLVYSRQEFTAGLGSATIWAVDASSQLLNSASTTVTYPTLTPSSGTDLYAGFSQASSTATSGSTAGYTYQTTSSSFERLVYNLAVSAASHPVSTQASALASLSVAALFTATLPTGKPRMLMVNQAVNRASCF